MKARALLLALLSLAAQHGGVSGASPSALSFSAASVRRNDSGRRTGGIRPLPSGRLTATNVTLRELILRAYSLHDSQMFTAFQEQLGLKLDAEKNPVDVVAIDAVAQPTAN